MISRLCSPVPCLAYYIVYIMISVSSLAGTVFEIFVYLQYMHWITLDFLLFCLFNKQKYAAYIFLSPLSCRPHHNCSV